MIYPLEGSSPTPSFPDKDYNDFLYPAAIAKMRHQSAYHVPQDDVDDSHLSVSLLLPRNMITLLEQVTGCLIMKAAVNDKTLFLGADSKDKIFDAERKLHVLSKYCVSRANRHRLVLHR